MLEDEIGAPRRTLGGIIEVRDEYVEVHFLPGVTFLYQFVKAEDLDSTRDYAVIIFDGDIMTRVYPQNWNYFGQWDMEKVAVFLRLYHQGKARMVVLPSLVLSDKPCVWWCLFGSDVALGE